MPTEQPIVDELLERVRTLGEVTAKKMFGEYCLYLSGKPVALICDDTLYVKITEDGRELVPDAPLGHPYPGAKVHLAFTPETWPQAPLTELLQLTYDTLPSPKPKKRKTK
jgi:TfoX/Sxy family transcriptional regulator of competence genes